MDTLIQADYFAEVTDEKIAGTIILRRDTAVAVYSVPGNSRRSMILTEQGLKFCLKGRPEVFMNPDNMETRIPELLVD
tara:strand:+ start:6045 stop:6278 length:234 start_codon:yes stop_codon:yes gene_type:complete